MPNLVQLRLAAREIFDEALRAVDPGEAIRRAVRREGSVLNILDKPIDIQNRKVYSISIGKGASAMAIALEDIISERFAEGLIAGPGARRPPIGDIAMRLGKFSARWRWIEGGHPEPNEQSLSAAQASFDLLARADKEFAFVVFLISGGGSTMIEWPIAEDITLADLRTANKALVNCGASIAEINAVRRTFSAIKGSRLAARAPNCDQITLIISDVPPGDERNVASGPTLAPPPNAPEPREVVERYGLRKQLPASITRAIDQGLPKLSDTASTTLRESFVLLDNTGAVEAAAKAARARGFTTEVAPDISDQPIQEGCDQLLLRLAQMRTNGDSVCLISGGEFACRVTGDGTGGRNLETALRLARIGSSDTEHFVALCAGTDGIDGNSPAAGAIVDDTTKKRADAIGLDVEDFLIRSDAYSFFVALGDVIATGPTGTNVRDIRILLTGK